MKSGNNTKSPTN
jgi:hypothetical protein